MCVFIITVGTLIAYSQVTRWALFNNYDSMCLYHEVDVTREDCQGLLCKYYHHGYNIVVILKAEAHLKLSMQLARTDRTLQLEVS